jgi:hypothetical protein
MSVFAGRVDTAYGRRAPLEDGEMERWVLATLFASGSEPRDVYINVLFLTKMERVGDHTEVEFSSGGLCEWRQGLGALARCYCYC